MLMFLGVDMYETNHILLRYEMEIKTHAYMVVCVLKTSTLDPGFQVLLISFLL